MVLISRRLFFLYLGLKTSIITQLTLNREIARARLLIEDEKQVKLLLDEKCTRSQNS